jgi:arginine-tRNA-protein transferase
MKTQPRLLANSANLEPSNEDQTFLRLNAAPTEMDQLWAEGWRHFGILFFRYRTAVHDGKEFSVLPLRVVLERFTLARSQNRVLRKNRDTQVVIRPASVDEAKQALFSKHILRYRENIPSSIYDFLSPTPASIPCPNVELCIFLDGRLIGVTYLDIGQTATSAVYAMFDPVEGKRSLGILMMIHSIQFSQERGYRYYYPGYAYHEPFAYDYKKRFVGMEYLDWTTGWKPMCRLTKEFIG